jgi:hypothetical protein
LKSVSGNELGAILPCRHGMLVPARLMGPMTAQQVAARTCELGKLLAPKSDTLSKTGSDLACTYLIGLRGYHVKPVRTMGIRMKRPAASAIGIAQYVNGIFLHMFALRTSYFV